MQPVRTTGAGPDQQRADRSSAAAVRRRAAPVVAAVAGAVAALLGAAGCQQQRADNKPKDFTEAQSASMLEAYRAADPNAVAGTVVCPSRTCTSCASSDTARGRAATPSEAGCGVGSPVMNA